MSDRGDGRRESWGGNAWPLKLVQRAAVLAWAGPTSLPFATLGLGDKRVLLVAPSHGGKSTLIAFALVPGALPDRARPLLIDDNETWFDPWNRAICLSRPLMVRRHTTELLAGRLPELDRFDSYPHDRDALIGRPDRRAGLFSRHRIDAIAFLQRSEGVSRLHDVDPERAGVQAAYVLKGRLGKVPHARQVRCLHRLITGAKEKVFRLEFDAPEEGVVLLGQLHDRLVSA